MSETSYINKKGLLRLKIYDATATTNKKFEAIGISSFPTFTDPKKVAELVDYLPQGVITGRYLGNESIDTPDVTLNLDLLEEMMTDNAFNPEVFCIKFLDPTDGTTALTSTNTTGIVTVLGENGEDVTIALPKEIKTLGLAVLWESPNADTTKDFGKDFKICRFTKATYNTGGSGETSNLELSFQIHQRGTTITKAEFEAL